MSPRVFALLSLACGLLFASQAAAQVLVYRIEFDHSKGINYHPYDGGYFVAPLLGGASSFLLTSSDGPKTLTTSASGGTFFTAVSGGGDKKAVMSAVTGSASTTTTTTTGTGSGFFVAIGDIKHVLHVNSPTASLSVTVAKSLIGTAASADSESTATAPAADGSIGTAGISELRLILDESQTSQLNSQGMSLTQAVAQLTLVLENEGYSVPTSTTTTTTGTTTTGTTTTGTTTTTGS